MNERLKLLRKTLDLSQDAFAERIGMKGSSISLLESGRRNITEQVIKSICREFNVDYGWLTTGVGEMFVDSDEDFLARIDAILVDENEDRRNMIKTLLYASDEDIEAVSRLVKYFYDLKHNNMEE
jgi:transcriptional regulator with XRE-family HTH domain